MTQNSKNVTRTSQSSKNFHRHLNSSNFNLSTFNRLTSQSNNYTHAWVMSLKIDRLPTIDELCENECETSKQIDDVTSYNSESITSVVSDVCHCNRWYSFNRFDDVTFNNTDAAKIDCKVSTAKEDDRDDFLDDSIDRIYSMERVTRMTSSTSLRLFKKLKNRVRKFLKRLPTFRSRSISNAASTSSILYIDFNRAMSNLEVNGF